MFRLVRIACLALLFCLSTSFAEVKLVVNGLTGEQDKNVQARLSMIPSNQISDSLHFKSYLESEVKKALRALGYYEPKFTYNTSDPKILKVKVNAGEAIRIIKLNVNITGEGKEDKDFKELLNTKLPKIGDILNHGSYTTFKKNLQNISLKKGYFDENLAKHELAVSEANHAAIWNIDFDTGKRFKYGKLNYGHSHIRDNYLKNISPFKEGDYFNADDISLYNRRLASTNWFNSVIVSPNFEHVGNDKVLPIDILTSPRSKNNMDLGLGYSSDNGVNGKIGWNKPWINSRGQSFHSNIELSSPERIIALSYKIPLKKSPLEDYYTIRSGYKKINNKDTYSNSYTFGVLRNWDNYQGWQSSLGINALYDNFTQGYSSYETMLYYPSFSFSRLRTDGKLFPLWGDSQRYSLEIASKSLASDIDLIRIQAQQSWIRSFFEHHRFVLRGNLGFIKTDDFNRVPPAFRFFVGGDRSIRGYSYQSIAPRDSKDKLKGGSKMITGSFEYQYNFSGPWWGAVFIDTGESIEKVEKAKFYTGAGAGVRWASPIGPIKFDIATPVDHGNPSLHIYIGLGVEL